MGRSDSRIITLDEFYRAEAYGENPFRRFSLGEGVELERFGLWPAGQVEVPAMEHHRISAHVQEDGNRAPSQWLIEGRRFEVELQPSLVMAVPAGQGLRAYWDAPARGTLNFLFSPRSLEQILEESGMPSQGVELLPGELGLDPQLLSLISKLNGELTWPGLAGRLLQDALRLQILIHICRRYTSVSHRLSSAGPKPNEGFRRPALDRVIDYMQAHLDQPVALDTLADLAQVSRFHFSRMFKKSVGRSPMQELQRLRLERAKELIRLEGEQKSLAAIATECGFTDQSHLGRVFKRSVGVTPGAFRRDS